MAAGRTSVSDPRRGSEPVRGVRRLRVAVVGAAALLRQAMRATRDHLTGLVRATPAGTGDVEGGSGSPPASPLPAATGDGSVPRTSPPTSAERLRRTALRLSVAVVGLLAGASTTGLAWRGLYRDAAATAAVFRAHDLSSPTVATPLLAGALVRARQGSPLSLLLWAGMLAHVVHTCAYHVFGAAFNALFLAHVVVFVLAAVALVLLLATVRLTASSVIQVDYVLALWFQAAARLPGATAFDPQEPVIAAAIPGAAAALLAGLRRSPVAAATGPALRTA